MSTLADFLGATAGNLPDKPVVLWEGGALTWRELDTRAAALAHALVGRGVKAGDRLAIAIGNRPGFVVAFLAGLELGATLVPIDTLLKANEVQPILDDVKPSLVLSDADVTTALGGESVGGKRTGAGGAGGALGPGGALILYTSGSTGRPKGAVLSDAALSFAVRSWAEPVMALTPGDVVLAVLPLAHSFGLNGALLAPLLAGASVVLVERFAPEAAVAAIRERGVTVFPGVATMFRRILEAPGLELDCLPTLRLAVSGAAPCPWDLAREWRRRTGVRILRGYGMTELFRPISYLADDPLDVPEAVGRPVPGVEVRIAGDAGAALPAGEVGELWIRTPAAMDGYLDAPEETQAVLGGGWFRTGDVATLTPEGCVRIVGRKRERILRGGYSVFPPEVEAVLLAHPSIAEAAVIGVSHPELGEEVAAFVVLRPGAAAGPAELIGYCKERLAGFKYPRHVTFLDALPRSATGKVLKSRLGSPIQKI